MGVSSFVPDDWLFALGLVFLFFSIILLSLNRRQRDAILHSLSIHRQRASGASTPPRSFSPSKCDKALPDNKVSPSLPSQSPDYVKTFPPSRRFVLAELAEPSSLSTKAILMSSEPQADFLLIDALPTTRPYDLENEIPKYTPTGFSTVEIKALGDFPPYDILSGVPLPQAYKDFIPERALPRPYRPFRWAYHQTMCKFCLALALFRKSLTYL
jgi:hypothetical protein